MRRRATGFTLIELLTVIAIIAVLAALIFPVLGKAQARAYQARCTSNLKQIGASIQMYHQDWDDRFPFAVDFTDEPLSPLAWANSGIPDVVEIITKLEAQLDPLDGDPHGGRIDHVLRPYLRNEEVLRCPADTGFGGISYAAYKGPFILVNRPPYVPVWQQSRNYGVQSKWGGISYLYRSELGLWRKPVTRLYRSASEVNVLMDATHYWHAPLRRNPRYSPDGVNHDMADAEQGSFNTLFADGHVRRLNWRQNYEAWVNTSHYVWGKDSAGRPIQVRSVFR